jgi:hypothetical protein
MTTKMTKRMTLKELVGGVKAGCCWALGLLVDIRMIDLENFHL